MLAFLLSVAVILLLAPVKSDGEMEHRCPTSLKAQKVYNGTSVSFSWDLGLHVTTQLETEIFILGTGSRFSISSPKLQGDRKWVMEVSSFISDANASGAAELWIRAKLICSPLNPVAASSLISATIESFFNWNLRLPVRSVADSNLLLSTDSLAMEPASWFVAKDNATEKLFRCEFQLPDEFETAILQVSGIGTFESYLNGFLVNPKNFLEPGTTKFSNYSLLVATNVTEVLRLSRNQLPWNGNTSVLGIRLGNGWYGMTRSYDSRPKLIAKLIIDSQLIVFTGLSSDAGCSWKVIDGPIVMNDIYNGETFDESKEVAGWNLPGNASDMYPWEVPTLANSSAFSPACVVRQFPPIQMNETLLPVANWTLPSQQSGINFDFGRDISGVCEIEVEVGPGGGTIVLRHGEILDHYNPGRSREIYYGRVLGLVCGIQDHDPLRTWTPSFGSPPFSTLNC